jgi:hypothetical protein
VCYAAYVLVNEEDYSLHLKVSLRTDCSAPPCDAAALREIGLLDVFLCPRTPDAPHLDAWFQACRAAGLPLRLQLQAPFAPNLDTEAIAGRIADAEVKAVNVVLSDPFQQPTPCRDPEHSKATIEKMNALVAALDARDVEANLYGLPLCLVREENRVRAGNRAQFFLDHQQYDRRSYEFATMLHARGPRTAGRIITLYLARYTALNNPLDEWILRWLIVKHPWFYSLITLWRKLRRSADELRRKTRAPEEPLDADRLIRLRSGAPAAPTAGPTCAACSLRRICDQETDAFKAMLPGISVKTQAGDLCIFPLHYMMRQRKYYDAIDTIRRDARPEQEALAQEAQRIMAGRLPDHVVPAKHYAAANTFFEPLSSAVRWHSMTNTEKRCSLLWELQAPFAVSVTFGGGIADYIGFSVTRYIKIVCPMTAYSHRLTLYVAEDGRYVLLRDGEPIPPAQLEGRCYAPLRLPRLMEVRLSLWNIDENITTQDVHIWEGAAPAALERRRAVYSVVIFSTRFARRLQATLECIAHQCDIELATIEVIVGYVPGIDATDDVLQSFQLAHPDLEIRRAPFAEQHIKAKGFVINECVRMASGAWIIVLDSDILLPPDLFARMQREAGDSVFLAPDGRVMLDPETTAKVLLGEIRPWESWPALLGSGAYRHREAEGIPIGFCQIVRAACFEKVRYEEYEHFAIADSNFGLAMRERFGPEKRLTGTPVIHLDHGGSHWFGTYAQL